MIARNGIQNRSIRFAGISLEFKKRMEELLCNF